MARHSESSDSMRVVVLDLEQIGTTLTLLDTEWRKLDEHRSTQIPAAQRGVIQRQEHIEGIMSLLRNAGRRADGQDT